MLSIRSISRIKEVSQSLEDLIAAVRPLEIENGEKNPGPAFVFTVLSFCSFDRQRLVIGVKDEKRHIDRRGMLTRRLTLAIESFRSQSDQYRLINVEFL